MIGDPDTEPGLEAFAEGVVDLVMAASAAAVRDFVEALPHGTPEYGEWLRRQAEAYIAGRE